MGRGWNKEGCFVLGMGSRLKSSRSAFSQIRVVYEYLKKRRSARASIYSAEFRFLSDLFSLLKQGRSVRRSTTNEFYIHIIISKEIFFLLSLALAQYGIYAMFPSLSDLTFSRRASRPTQRPSPVSRHSFAVNLSRRSADASM